MSHWVCVGDLRWDYQSSALCSVHIIGSNNDIAVGSHPRLQVSNLTENKVASAIVEGVVCTNIKWINGVAFRKGDFAQTPHCNESYDDEIRVRNRLLPEDNCTRWLSYRTRFPSKVLRFCSCIQLSSRRHSVHCFITITVIQRKM
jgi:hypothetical protein